MIGMQSLLNRHVFAQPSLPILSSLLLSRPTPQLQSLQGIELTPFSSKVKWSSKTWQASGRKETLSQVPVQLDI